MAVGELAPRASLASQLSHRNPSHPHRFYKQDCLIERTAMSAGYTRVISFDPLDAMRLADALGPSRAERAKGAKSAIGTEGAESGFTPHGRQSLSGTCWAAWTKSLSVDSKVRSWRPHS